MSDESNDQPKAEETPPVDLGALIKELNDGFEKRFRGVQALMDQRDEKYRQMLDDLRNADLTPEEREQVEASKWQQEAERYKRKAELLSLARSFPEEVDLLDKYAETTNLAEQIQLLSQFRKATPPAAPTSDEEQAEADGKPTPVDLNNPARKGQPALEAAAERMNKELSEQILSSSGNDKGILARLRRG
jgi:hypothetical protein